MNVSPRSHIKVSPAVQALVRGYAQKTGRTQMWIANTALLQWLHSQPDFEELEPAIRAEQGITEQLPLSA